MVLYSWITPSSEWTTKWTTFSPTYFRFGISFLSSSNTTYSDLFSVVPYCVYWQKSKQYKARESFTWVIFIESRGNDLAASMVWKKPLFNSKEKEIYLVTKRWVSIEQLMDKIAVLVQRVLTCSKRIGSDLIICWIDLTPLYANCLAIWGPAG